MLTDISQIESLHKYSHSAMATVFDIFIQSDDENYSGQAAWEAFKEIDRLEEELSRFNPNSEVSRINNSAPGERLIVSPDIFECVRESLELKKLTMGAFDIAYFNSAEISAAENLLLNNDEMSIMRLDERICIDLGGIGKGYAVEKIEEILREWEITRALISGGFSSVKAVGSPDGFDGWPISISNPVSNSETILNFYMQDYSVSGSGLKKGMHIIDPSTGKPSMSKTACWALARSAIVSEALSTAFMILDESKVKNICDGNDGFYSVILNSDYLSTKNIFKAGNSSVIKKID
ncbi:MAG: hypothetical protein CVV24_14460 [Ignavibacteriae bacterium HGW-Ignavibacteriae-3]|nr:MAG: hypothetical protein CVV24_14460 [Ignavibacteriae bacterium HGW-Ignavibacteriae-3]